MLTVSDQPLFTGATAVYPYSDVLMKRFTLVDRFERPVQLAERHGDKIRLPRAACPLGEDDRRVVGPSIQLTSAVSPRNDEQARVISEAIGLLLAGENFLLQATTGFGKTVVCCPIIAHMGRKTLVIVHKEDLMKQWRERLQQFLPGVKIGTIRQNKYDVAGKDIVIGMIQSLAKKDKYPTSMRSEFGFVIWDECHHVPADTFEKTARIFPAKLRMGLSATPQRRDGRDVVLHAHIGQVQVETQLNLLEPKVALYDSPWKCPMKPSGDGRYKPIPHTAGKCGHITNMIVRNQARNELIWKIAFAGYKKGRICVVFSDRVAHLEQFYSMAMTCRIPPKDVALYISGLTDKQREQAQAKPLILATYGMMSEGTDIPWLDLCIMATPRSQIKQPVGRVLREYPDKPKPVVIDIVDRTSPVFAKYAVSRLRQYTQMNAEVVRYRSHA